MCDVIAFKAVGGVRVVCMRVRARLCARVRACVQWGGPSVAPRCPGRRVGCIVPGHVCSPPPRSVPRPSLQPLRDREARRPGLADCVRESTGPVACSAGT